jgi:phycocyanobilin lyase subunit beta
MAYSIRTLAAIGDPRALEVLLTASATDFAPTVRRSAAKGLGFLQWHKLPEGDRTTAQFKAMDTLLSLTQDSDWSIRYAAIVGLQALAKIPELQSSIQTRLEEMLASDAEKAIRARVLLAQQQVPNPQFHIP